jgi:hypothetical protein
VSLCAHSKYGRAALFYHEAHRATKTGGGVNRADLNTHSVFKIKMIILNDFEPKQKNLKGTLQIKETV